MHCNKTACYYLKIHIAIMHNITIMHKELRRIETKSI